MSEADINDQAVGRKCDSAQRYQTVFGHRSHITECPFSLSEGCLHSVHVRLVPGRFLTDAKHKFRVRFGDLGIKWRNLPFWAVKFSDTLYKQTM